MAVPLQHPQAAPDPRSQLLFALFFGGGSLLNLVCAINHPMHRHSGVWFWLQTLALLLMFLGVGFQLRTAWRLRRAKRQG